MANFTAAVALLKKPIDEVYQIASGTLKAKIANIRASEKVKEIHKRLYELQRVKTIWQTDRPIILSTFFYPAAVSSAEGERTQQIKSVDDFPENHVIVFGTVGQGKSMLIRYLLSRDITSGTRVPLLCELRNLAGFQLEDWLSDKFASFLGLSKDYQVFKFFADNGKISFLLDGFDEIDPEQIQRVNFEIDALSSKFPNCRIVLTSRPDSDCKYLPNFYSYKIKPLTKDDLFGFYKKISRDEDFSKRIVAAIDNSPLEIKNLIDTPLLATLLAISYRSAHRIPLDFAEFYDELFQILLTRHDASKLGWRRTRSSKLDDRLMQQTFEAFCFATRKSKLTALDKVRADELAGRSLQEMSCQATATQFLDDICKITCLLTYEDKRYSFVHGSVQEFFSARFLKTRTEAKAQIFYEQLLGGRWSDWQRELLFLRQIDAYKANKFFFLPEKRMFLSLFMGEFPSVQEAAVQYLKGIAVEKRKSEKTAGFSYFVNKIRSWHVYSSVLLDQRIYSILFSSAKGVNPWYAGFDSNVDARIRSYYQIALDRGGMLDDLISLIAAFISQVASEIDSDKIKIEREENPSDFMSLE